MCCAQVLFSTTAEKKIQQLVENPSIEEAAKRAAVILQNTVNVINQVGTHTITYSKLLKLELLSHSFGDPVPDFFLSYFQRLLAMPFLTCS